METTKTNESIKLVPVNNWQRGDLGLVVMKFLIVKLSSLDIDSRPDNCSLVGRYAGRLRGGPWTMVSLTC